ncbi:MAG: replicative DNA helicase [Desulfobacterales bacterium]|nr:replicative DNA helicase [Desulfobacterales bacterium]
MQNALSFKPIKKNIVNKHLPQNLEAEESLISAVMLDNNIFYEIIDIVSPEDFYKPVHMAIFSAIKELFHKNEPVDIVTLSNRLKEQGKIDEVGGQVYLAGLLETVPVAVNAPYYAKIIHEKAVLRKLIQTSHIVVNKCYEDKGSIEDVIDLAERSIFEISNKKAKPSFYHVNDILTGNLKLLEDLCGKKRSLTGVPSGFYDLDKMTAGFQKSDLIIMAARPGMGKTALALNIARNAAVDHDIPAAIFSLEMSKEQLVMRLLSSECRINLLALRNGYFQEENWTRVTEGASILSSSPIYIDDSPSISSLELRAKARRLKLEKNIGIIIVDYLQLMKSSFNVERRDLEISEISRSLKALAKELDIPVIALSQLNRKLEERADKRPLLSDLRESGSIEQDSDVVIFIHREEVYKRKETSSENNSKEPQVNQVLAHPENAKPNFLNEKDEKKIVFHSDSGAAEIIIGKQRNGPMGKIDLVYLGGFTKFENAVKSVPPILEQG